MSDTKNRRRRVHGPDKGVKEVYAEGHVPGVGRGSQWIIVTLGSYHGGDWKTYLAAGPESMNPEAGI